MTTGSLPGLCSIQANWREIVALGEGLKVGFLKLRARKQSLEHLLLEKEALRASKLDDAGDFARLTGVDQCLLLTDDQLGEVARFESEMENPLRLVENLIQKMRQS
jgi:hypothetical protein